MITDIYKLMDNVTPIKDIIDNNNKFTHFFDSFILNIKHNEKDNSNIKKAREILNNIDKRNLYTWIGDYYFPNDLPFNYLNEFDKFNANILIENKDKDDVELKPDDIRIKKEIQTFGPGNGDPFSNLLFYDNEYNIIELKAENVSKLLPNRYKSYVIRVFVTNKDEKKIEAATNALKNYKEIYKGITLLYKNEQKSENKEILFNKSYNEIFKNNKSNINKASKLGKKRNSQIGYNDFHEQLSKKKINFK